MKRILSTLSLAVFALSLQAATSIEKLLNDGAIELKITSTGDHEGECVKFEVRNLTKNNYEIMLEPGRRLISDDPEEQDIFITQEQILALKRGRSVEFMGKGFCCQSGNACPDDGSGYSIGSMADPKWVEFARFCSGHQYADDAVQHAVWCLSDDHKVSGIYGGSDEDVNKIREKVAKLKGVEVPWYTTHYDEPEGDQVFNPNAVHISGIIDFTIDKSTTLTSRLRRIDGEMPMDMSQDMEVRAGKYTYDFELEVQGWPEGEYVYEVVDTDGDAVLTRAFSI